MKFRESKRMGMEAMGRWTEVLGGYLKKVKYGKTSKFKQRA